MFSHKNFFPERSENGFVILRQALQYHEKTKPQGFPWGFDGGAEGNRTPDLNTASVALSQLSYGPLERARTLMVAPSTVKQKSYVFHSF